MFDSYIKAGNGLNILNNHFFNPRSYAGVNISRAGFVVLSTIDPKSETIIKSKYCLNKASKK